MKEYHFGKNDFLEALNKIRGEKDALWMAFENNTDRAFAIVVASVLGDLLEDIIKASYIKDPKVKSLFKDDHILQSFHSKIHIAYFSGLIPEFVYHDLSLVGRIRNKFAHGVTTNLTFKHKSIAQLINNMKLAYNPLPDTYMPGLEFMLAVTRLISALQAIEVILSKARPPHLVELFRLNEFPIDKDRLSEAEVRSLLQKGQ